MDKRRLRPRQARTARGDPRPMATMATRLAAAAATASSATTSAAVGVTQGVPAHASVLGPSASAATRVRCRARRRCSTRRGCAPPRAADPGSVRGRTRRRRRSPRSGAGHAHRSRAPVVLHRAACRGAGALGHPGARSGRRRWVPTRRTDNRSMHPTRCSSSPPNCCTRCCASSIRPTRCCRILPPPAPPDARASGTHWPRRPTPCCARSRCCSIWRSRARARSSSGLAILGWQGNAASCAARSGAGRAGLAEQVQQVDRSALPERLRQPSRLAG